MNPPGNRLELAPPSSRVERAAHPFLVALALMLAFALVLAAILVASSKTAGDDADSEFRSEIGRNSR